MKHQKIIGAVTGDARAMGTLEFEVAPGPVTLARLTETPDGEFKLLIAEGRVVEAEGETFGAHGWVEVSDLDCLYRALLADFPHHVGMVQGHVGRALKEAGKFLGITPVVPLELSA
jgi:L-fucose isomerase-like protein